MVAAFGNDCCRSRTRAKLLLAITCLLAILQTVYGSPDPTSVSSHVGHRTTATSESSSTLEELPTGVTTIYGQPSPTTTSAASHDPLLAIMPDFIYSMPAQIVVDGINLSLVSTLAIQLVFTAQYHFPLSRKNYILQLISVLLLLISIAVHLHVVLRRLEGESHVWPYMFPYIGVQIPPQDGSWNLVQEAFYLALRSVSSALIHLTHIQFLTLLFPSALEARLILWMLGPLALAASGMEFTALSSENDVKTSDLGDAIRNICNSALFMLYTSALLIWGVFVNRRRAWRTDGGTAAFGGGSVGLAIINTAISFVEIPYDRLWWLPDICWTLTIWQSWLGFWWWVGSGMGIGEVEDRAERQERLRKKEERLKRKRAREEKHRQKASLGTSGAGAAVVAASSTLSGKLRDFWPGGDKLEGGTLTRRSKSARPSNADQGQQDGEGIKIERSGEEVEEGDGALTSIAVENGETGVNDEIRTVAASSSDTQPTTSGAATSITGWVGSVTTFFAEHQPDFIKRRLRRLRLEHVAAARRAATEQSVLRDQVLNRQSAVQAPGLRNMMFENRPVQPQPGDQHPDGMVHSMTMDSNFSSTIEHHLSLPVLDMERGSTTSSIQSNLQTPLESSVPFRAEEDEWVDEETEVPRQAVAPTSEQEEIATSVDDGSRDDVPHTTSWSWRGGLKRLRMRDHSRYD